MAGVRRYENFEVWQLAGELKREVYVEFAVASAMETRDSLKDGMDRGYFVPERAATAQRLAERTIRCSSRFIVYLKEEAERRRKRKRVKAPRKNEER